MNYRKTEGDSFQTLHRSHKVDLKPLSYTLLACFCASVIVAVTKLLNERIFKYGEVVFKCPAVSDNQGIYLDLTTL